MRRSRRFQRTWRSAAAALVVIIVAGLVVPLSVPQPADAAIGAPDPGSALLQVRIGDYRSSATEIAPLGGVTLGLFLNEPSASIDADSGFAHPDPSNPVLFSCVSDADGDCVFQVPVRAGIAAPGADQTPPFANNADPARGVPQGTRLYVAKLAAPAGYYANPLWQTGPLSPSPGDPLTELRHVWQSPPLVADRSYLSGVDWITDPGLQTSPSHATPNYTRRIASSGTVVLSRENPELPEQCGLNVALIVDVSSSVNGSQGQLVTAMNQFVDALRGTPSQLALLTFGTDSPGAGFPSNTPLRSVATAAEAQAFKNLYDDNSAPSGSNRDWDDPTFRWPTNYTNWDRGFAAAATANGDAAAGDTHYDLAVFLTDGNPTVYGENPLAGSTPKDRNSGYTRFRELSNGLASANLLKSQDTRVLAVGVGAGISAPEARDNLRTVSGTSQFDGSNIDTADYIQTSDYAQAGNALRTLILSDCAPSLSVVKRIVPPGATVTDAYLPTESWTFDADAVDPGVSVSGSPGQTAIGSGGVSFPIGFDESAPPGTAAQIRIEEDVTSPPHNTYTPLPSETRCVERSTGLDVPLTVTPASDAPATAFTVPVGLQEMVTCIVYNQAPPPMEPASVAVHKLWRIVTAPGVQVVPDGAQPSGVQADLAITGPDTEIPTAQNWSATRAGYNVVPAAAPQARTVRITEETSVHSSLPLCTIDDEPLIRPGAPDPSAPLSDYTTLDPAAPRPLQAGLNEWTVLNEVQCSSELTLIKDVTNGRLNTTAGETEWTLEAVSPMADPPWNTGVSGTTGVTAEVYPGAEYPLRETANGSEPLALHYRQHDLRSRPLFYPQSSGSWECRTRDGAPGEVVTGTEGAVSVPLGQHYECTAANSTSLLEVTKTVRPSGDPSAFTFRLEPIPPVLNPDLPSQDFTAGQLQSLLPGQRYRLTELAEEGYSLTSLTCDSNGTPFDPSDFTLPEGAAAECAAVNQYGDWTALKSSDPESGTTIVPGQTITYQVSTDQLLEDGESDGVVVTDDLTGVLDDADLHEESISTTAGSAVLDGSILRWTLDNLTGNEVLTYQVTVNDTGDGVLDNVLRQDGGTPCSAVREAPGPFRVGCDRTTHPIREIGETPPPTPSDPSDDPSGALPVTGASAPISFALLGAAALLVGWLTVARRRFPTGAHTFRPRQ
jgi:LPXTG-motif cell wall-anchored protein